jgi:hypothetical protein
LLKNKFSFYQTCSLRFDIEINIIEAFASLRFKIVAIIDPHLKVLLEELLLYEQDLPTPRLGESGSRFLITNFSANLKPKIRTIER